MWIKNIKLTVIIVIVIIVSGLILFDTIFLQ
jgi:hypothetical protein